MNGQYAVTQRDEIWEVPRRKESPITFTGSYHTSNVIGSALISSVVLEQYFVPCQTATTIPSPPVPAPRFREKEMKWFEKNLAGRRELEGRWVVVEGEELVACERDYAAASQKARARRGIKAPFIFYVPERTDDIFMGL